ncbi:MAG TPA: dTDP-4-dehydrorhamnose 3,5-epimerase family protein [Candidatus Elarobacter sp.]
MTVVPSSIDGLYVVSYAVHEDERGSFARVFDRDVFLAHGLCAGFPHHGFATNRRRGVVRGLHYQTAPFAETKLVHVVGGRVWDVIADVRRTSPTYGRWEAFELDENRPQMLYVAAGLAHGYQVLSDGAKLHYLLSAPYAPDHAAGVHWRDPRLAIPWPLDDVLVGPRDTALPTLEGAPEPL